MMHPSDDQIATFAQMAMPIVSEANELSEFMVRGKPMPFAKAMNLMRDHEPHASKSLTFDLI